METREIVVKLGKDYQKLVTESNKHLDTYNKLSGFNVHSDKLNKLLAEDFMRASVLILLSLEYSIKALEIRIKQKPLTELEQQDVMRVCHNQVEDFITNIKNCCLSFGGFEAIAFYSCYRDKKNELYDKECAIEEPPIIIETATHEPIRKQIIRAAKTVKDCYKVTKKEKNAAKKKESR